MKTSLYILTGASRGMGLALAEQLCRPGHRLLCLSRRTHDPLQALAQSQQVPLEQWSVDLARADVAADRLRQWLATLAPESISSATLINNAGVIPRIGPLRDAQGSDLSNALRVGLEAPMLLCAVFLQATASWNAERRILNISSGLGRRAMASQAAYCAAKAGMDHFTRCMALDEASKPQGARVCSLAPGVIDTDMQVQLRGAHAADFPDLGNFRQLKETGMLSTPQDAAARVLAYLARPDFGANPVADVRDPA
jgi:benzil reductase ((S)-benzoin forming)